MQEKNSSIKNYSLFKNTTKLISINIASAHSKPITSQGQFKSSFLINKKI